MSFAADAGGERVVALFHILLGLVIAHARPGRMEGSDVVAVDLRFPKVRVLAHARDATVARLVARQCELKPRRARRPLMGLQSKARASARGLCCLRPRAACSN